MSGTKQHGVKVFIHDGEGEFLFLLRNKPLPGEIKPGWDIPGGRIKTDRKTKIRENPVDALQREVWEETKLILDLGSLQVIGFQSFIFEPYGIEVERTYFSAQHLRDKAESLNPGEHIASRWGTIAFALGHLPLNPVLHDFLDLHSGGVGGVPASSQITI